MITQSLIDYLKQQTKNGIALEQIKSDLNTAGWSEADINEAFAGIGIEALPILNNNVPSAPQISSVKTTEHTKGALIVAIVGALLIIGIGSGYYWWFYSNKQASIVVDKPEKTTEQQKEITAQYSKSPKELYIEYQAAIENTKTYEELRQIVGQYLTSALNSQNFGYQQVEPSEELKQQLVVIAKTIPPLLKDIVDIKEEISETTGKLFIKTTTPNELCVVTVVSENNTWKFGNTECKTQTVSELPSQSFVPSCGSILWKNIQNFEGQRTTEEEKVLSCFVPALLNCSPKAMTVRDIQTATYEVASKESEYCNIIKRTNFIKSCRVPLAYISNERAQWKKDGTFLQGILGIIDAGGKSTNFQTGQVKVEFECK